MVDVTADEAARRGWRDSGTLLDRFGHVFIYTHTTVSCWTSSPCFSDLLHPPLCCELAVLTGSPVAGSGKRLESSDIHFPGSLSACTFLVTVIGTAAAVLWDRSCLFPQGGFIIILFIYSLLHCLFVSTKYKSQEGRDLIDVFIPVSPGWLRVGAQ